MSLQLSLTLGLNLLCLSLLIQVFEMLAIEKRLQATAPWTWDQLRHDFSHLPRLTQTLISRFCGKGFRPILMSQIALLMALVVMPHWVWALGLLFTVFLTVLRFGGTFNGGSDTMTMTCLLGALLALWRPDDPSSVRLGLYYIAIQCTLSYFIAGIIKLKNRDWRNGRALRVFLEFSNYPIPPSWRQLARRPYLILMLSWIVILWECALPLIWAKPTWAPIYLLIGALFHLGNFVIFGLNRFFFAWIAAYPALFFCVQQNSLLSLTR